MSAAAIAAGVSRQTPYQVREREPDFAKQWDDALEEAYDKLEAEAWRRGVEGVSEPVFFMGLEVATVRKYSDSLLASLLQANRAKFRNKHNVELTGANGAPLENPDVAARLAAILSAAQARRDDSGGDS